MLNLSQKYTVVRLFLKCDFIRYTSPSLKLTNGEIHQVSIDTPREDCAISLKDSFLELDFIVTHRAAGHSRYADGDHIRLANLGPLLYLIK